MILIDSNVVVAAVYDKHQHHAEALAFLTSKKSPAMMLAAHSMAEAYVTLTRLSGPRPIGWSGPDTRTTLRNIRPIVRIVSMSAVQTLEALDAFAALGIGARLYDYLIGRTGVLHGAETIVTFNLRHMQSLFPGVAVQSPANYLEARA